MKNVKRTKQTEDDIALKESKEERKKETNKQRETKATTKDEWTTEEPHKIFKNQEGQCDRSQDAQKKQESILERKARTKQKIALFFFLARVGFISTCFRLCRSLYISYLDNKIINQFMS